MMKQLLCGMMMAGIYSSTVLASHTNNSFRQLSFIENSGQITNQYGEPRADLHFKLCAGPVNLFSSSTSMHYQWYRDAGTQMTESDTSYLTEIYRMDVILIGANPDADIIREDQTPYFERHYTGSSGEKGVSANAFRKITYKNVYPAIDWTIYVKGTQIEYDFTVHPGGNVSDIRMQYEGAQTLSINPDGSLTAVTPFGTLTEAAPVSYQQADGKTVASSFQLNDRILTFDVGDYTGTLVIDPVLEWASYFGGPLNESAFYNNLTGYGDDAIYMIGNTPSAENIATEGSHQTTIAGGTDGLIARFNAAGELQWCTYYGGTHGSDNVTGIVCDSEGNIFVTGHSQSTTGIATAGSYRSERVGSRDAFLVKFSDEGERIWGTYYGGLGQDKAMGIAIDKDDNIFITGFTLSDTGIASPGTHQVINAGLQDNFIAKFTNDGALLWGTFLGGPNYEEAYTAVCDSSGHVYIAGYTQSSSGIASTGAHQETWGGSKDGFIAKFSPDGSRIWSTYFGGEQDDQIYSLCTDGHHIYLTGHTKSPGSISTADAFKENISGSMSDVFISTFNTDGTLLWSTYFGGDSDEYSASILLTNNKLIITGTTGSDEGISTPGTYKDSLDGAMDGFITVFTTDGSREWGTYFGGNNHEQMFGAHMNSEHQLFFSGSTSSMMGLATEGSHQEVHGGNTWDLFLAVLNICETPAPEPVLSVTEICESQTVSFSVSPNADAIAYHWILPEGWTGSGTGETIEITAGHESGQIGIAIEYACGTSDTTWQMVGVLDTPQPMIVATGAVLSTTELYTTYQWYKNGELIEGATHPTYTISDISASYHVVVSNDSGCQGISDTYTSPLSTGNTPAPQILSFYPNPVRDYLTIEGNMPIRHITIHDAGGRLISQRDYTGHADLRDLLPGIYLITPSDSSGQAVGSFKVIKE